MALVKAPGVVVFFQTAADRLAAVYRHVDLGRQRIWHSISFAGAGSNSVDLAAAFHGGSGPRPRGVLADPDPGRDAAADAGFDVTDGGRALSVVLGAGNDFLLV